MNGIVVETYVFLYIVYKKAVRQMSKVRMNYIQMTSLCPSSAIDRLLYLKTGISVTY